MCEGRFVEPWPADGRRDIVLYLYLLYDHVPLKEKSPSGVTMTLLHVATEIHRHFCPPTHAPPGSQPQSPSTHPGNIRSADLAKAVNFHETSRNRGSEMSKPSATAQTSKRLHSQFQSKKRTVFLSAPLLPVATTSYNPEPCLHAHTPTPKTLDVCTGP